MRIQLTIVFILITPLIYGQTNLVPNPSFEDYSLCPNQLNQFEYVVEWTKCTYSTDYFNACDSTNVASVPLNNVGYQEASYGIAYSGLIISCAPGNYNYREFIGCELIDSFTTVLLILNNVL
jgi:hypothetical protein